MLQHGEQLLIADEMLFKARCRAVTLRVKKKAAFKNKKVDWREFVSILDVCSMQTKFTVDLKVRGILNTEEN